MPSLVNVGLMVSDKKIFKDLKKKFSFVARYSEEDHGRNISVKFHQNPVSSLREEDV